MLDLLIRNKSFRTLILFYIFNDSSVILLQMANGWLTLAITNSVFWTGAVYGFGGIGVVSFSLFGGILADKMNRKRILQITQPIDFICTLILGCSIYFHLISLWQILLIVLITGAIAGVRLPTREALLLDVVGKKKLVHAISVSFVLFTILGFLIPITNGILIDLDMSIGYFICSILILFSLLTITRLNIYSNHLVNESRVSFLSWSSINEIIKYLQNENIIKQILIIMLVSEIFGWSHNSMLPVMIREVFKLPATSLGLALSFASIGALIGTIIISQLSKSSYIYLVIGLMGFGVFLIGFSMANYFYLAVFCLTLAWGFAFIFEIKIYSYLQLITSDRMRGRILSLLAISYGLSSVSGFVNGTVGKFLGVEYAISLLGVFLMIMAIYAMFKLKNIDQKIENV